MLAQEGALVALLLLGSEGRWVSYGYPGFTCLLQPFILALLITAKCSGSALLLKGK